MKTRALIRRILTRGLVLGLLPMLAACPNPFYDLQQSHREIMTDRIAVADNPPAPAVYCYRTLAAPDCRTKPEPGQEDRLISYDGGNYSSPPR